MTPVAPVVSPIGDDSVADGVPYTGPTPVASGTAPISWTLVAGPSGMTIDSPTGVVSWSSPTVAGSPHTITIRATNAAGSGDETWSLTVTPVVVDAMHVGALDGSMRAGRKISKVKVTIRIHNMSHGQVREATVSGTWSGDYSGTGSCTTNKKGLCNVTSGNIPSGTLSVTFTIDDVTHAALTYQSADNDVGASITVSKP